MTRGAWRVVGLQAVVALLAAVCGAAFVPAFGGRVGADLGPAVLVVVLAVGAFVPAVVVAAGRLLRLPALAAAAAGLVVSIAAVLLASGVGLSIVQGPERILTTALPAVPDPPSRGSVGVFVALLSLAGVLIAAYAPMRLRALAVLPPLALVPCAFALDAGTRLPGTSYAIAVVVVAALALLLARPPLDRVGSRRRRRRPRPTIRTGGAVLGVLIVLAAAGGVVAAAAARLPGVTAHPAAVQNLIAPPLQARAAIAPLTQYPAFADGDDPVRLSGTTSRRVHLLPMVTLSTFTGQTWTTASRFRRAGTTLSYDRPAHPLTVTVHAGDASQLSWLVRPDRPVSVDRTGLGTDRSTGDLVVPVGARFPASYTVVGVAPVVDTVAEENDRAVLLRGAVATDTVQVPAVITRFADSAQPARSAYQQLLTLDRRLATGSYRLATGRSVPTGCGYAQLVDLLTDKTHAGTSEQYASLFALSARLLGYQSRVVIGFVPHYTGHGTGFTITGHDVRAWAQVRFAHAGWVAFDPTPSQTAGSKTAPQPKPAPQSSRSHAHRSPSASPTSGRHRSHAAGSGTARPVSAWWFALLALPVLLLFVPPGTKAARRRRRRRAPTPAAAVVAAWDETTDRLLEAGSPVRGGRSTGEVAAAAPGAARRDVSELGALLDRAGYAPETAAPGDAAAAWSLASRARRELRASMPRWRRVLAFFDPRPLRRH